MSSVRGSGVVCPGSLESPVHTLLTAVLSWVSLILPQWPPVPAYYILEASSTSGFFNRVPLAFHGHRAQTGGILLTLSDSLLPGKDPLKGHCKNGQIGA